MTVRELIAALSELPSDAEVWIDAGIDDQLDTLARIETDEEGNIVLSY